MHVCPLNEIILSFFYSNKIEKVKFSCKKKINKFWSVVTRPFLLIVNVSHLLKTEMIAANLNVAQANWIQEICETRFLSDKNE